MTNPYETADREAKAQKIAAVLRAAHPSLDTALPCSEFARYLETETRDVVAAVAGVKRPSDATWDVVVATLEEQEAAAGRVQMAGVR